MKKRLLTILALLANVVLAAVAQDTPAITFEAPATERTITIGLNAVGKKVSVDWGDGTIVEKESAADTWGDPADIDITGTPCGTVKIYGEDIVSFTAFTPYAADATEITGGITKIDLSKAANLTALDVHQNNLTSVDLSELTALTKLAIGVNDFETIDLSANTELTSVDLSNGKNNGKLTYIDFSKNTKLTTIVLSGNKLTSLDLSKNTQAKTITVLNNQLNSITLGANANKNHSINLGNNKLTSVDLSQFSNLTGSYIYLRDNDLTGDAIRLPEGMTVKRLWVDGNAYTLAQLYALKSLATQTFTYATTFTKAQAQQPYAIAESINVGETVDLSSQAVLGETATVFSWKNAEGTALVEGTDYTVNNGVFTFLTVQEAIHAEMTNAELNAFTAEKPYMTTTLKVTIPTGITSIKTINDKSVYYNLNGQRIATPTKGMFIQNGKKVIKK